jgi:hypothetical protein
MKSPISMINGRFNTSKCRGMLQKMGVLYTCSPKLPNYLFIFKLKKEKKKKNRA